MRPMSVTSREPFDTVGEESVHGAPQKRVEPSETIRLCDDDEDGDWQRSLSNPALSQTGAPETTSNDTPSVVWNTESLSIQTFPSEAHVCSERKWKTLLYNFHWNRVVSWDELEDRLAVLVGNDATVLQLLHSVYSVGVPDQVLRSLAVVALQIPDHDDPFESDTVPTSTTSTTTPWLDSSNALATVAHYLVHQHVDKRATRTRNGNQATECVASLACLRFLVTVRSPTEAGWQREEFRLAETLAFLTQRECCVAPEKDATLSKHCPTEEIYHSETTLLWELRALCLHELERLQEQALICQAWIDATAETTANCIETGAHVIKLGLTHSTTLVTTGIDAMGDVVQSCIDPVLREAGTNTEYDPRSTAAALTYTGAARRVTRQARECTQRTTSEVQDASCRAIQMAATQFYRHQVGHAVVPDDSRRHALAAAGKVGLAGLGAVVIVGEAVLESSNAVAQATVDATAGVVEHRYGAAAGQVVRNTSETAVNVFRTVGHVAMVKSRILGKAVVKKSAKTHMENQKPTTKVHAQRKQNISKVDRVTVPKEVDNSEQGL
jgi:hypothetical protein